ncbi:MAG TPA: hypothetical protein VFF55_03045, partial [Candidatus Deferrimicrobium sp.]|nr:hypothetical protein [Candidatus Deferrimicrobium sp.]
MEVARGRTMRRTAVTAVVLVASVSLAAVLPAAAIAAASAPTPDIGVAVPMSAVGSAEGRAFVPVQRFWSARR